MTGDYTNLCLPISDHKIYPYCQTAKEDNLIWDAPLNGIFLCEMWKPKIFHYEIQNTFFTVNSDPGPVCNTPLPVSNRLHPVILTNHTASG